MRILLIHPPDNKVSISPGRFEPLALEVLAACLPNHEVRIVDLRIDSVKELNNQFRTFQPALAGITANNTIHVNPAKQILNYIITNFPKVKLVVGGFHATMMPQDFRIPGVTAIFLGWAEKSFPEFVDALNHGKTLDEISGIEILENGKVKSHHEREWDLHPSDIPFPRRDLVKKYQFWYRSDMGFRTALVNTSRGCPSKCAFCGVWQVAEGHFLQRNPYDVFREIAEIPQSVKRVFFADDNTFINPKNAEALCKLIRDAEIQKKYSGYCRSDTIIRHPELMMEWKEAGLDNLCVGFEGTDNSRLNKLNKRNSEENNARAAQILNKAGIPFRPHFLIEPSFCKNDFKSLLNYVHRHQLKSPIFPILTPIPGTIFYHQVKDSIILNYNYFDFAHATIPTKLRPKEFYKSWINLYYKSYPVGKNLKNFLLKGMGKLFGNNLQEKNYTCLNLKYLLLIRLVGILLHVRLIRHYRSQSRFIKAPVMSSDSPKAISF